MTVVFSPCNHEHALRDPVLAGFEGPGGERIESEALKVMEALRMEHTWKAVCGQLMPLTCANNCLFETSREGPCVRQGASLRRSVIRDSGANSLP